MPDELVREVSGVEIFSQVLPQVRGVVVSLSPAFQLTALIFCSYLGGCFTGTPDSF